MDKTIPEAAAHIMDFIRLTEVGDDERAGYDVIYGHNQRHLPKPITSMTLSELRPLQKGFTKRFGSSATGGYQFMYRTLGGLITELGLNMSQKLDPDLQDRLGYHLMLRRGYQRWMNGQLSTVGFALNLAKEWASFPVLARTKGRHRTVNRGQSYYAGDGQNKALVDAEDIERVLSEAKAMSPRPPLTPRPPKPDAPGKVIIPPNPLPQEEPAVTPFNVSLLFGGLALALGLYLGAETEIGAHAGSAIGVGVAGLIAFVGSVIRKLRED